MIVHGMCPTYMLIGIIILISKVKRQVVCDSNNSRAIALSSIIDKVLDWIILMKEEKSLYSKVCLQLSAPIWLNETINYYNLNKTNVHLLLPDTSKAFDWVKYCTLFQERLNHNVSPMVLRLLSVMHINQTLQVKWKSKISDDFSVVNGVKQGGVLSPILLPFMLMGCYGSGRLLCWL